MHCLLQTLQFCVVNIEGHEDVIDLTGEAEQGQHQVLPAQLPPPRSGLPGPVLDPVAHPVYDDLVATLESELGEGADAVWICGPLAFCPSQSGDAGWGCGWRNCEMLLSHLRADASWQVRCDDTACLWVSVARAWGPDPAPSV